MLEHKILWKVLKTFSLECSVDDLDIFYGKVKFALWTYIWIEFMELVEDFCAKFY